MKTKKIKISDKKESSIAKALKNKNVLTIVLSLGIFLFALFISLISTSFNKQFQNLYYPYSHSIKQNMGKAHDDIVVVEIDSQTLKQLGRFPFSRDTYIGFLQNLEKAKPAVVGFDIIFADTTEEALDNALAEQFKKNKNIVIGSAIIGKGELESPLPLFQESVAGYGFFPPIVDRSNQTVYSFRPDFTDVQKNTQHHFSIQIVQKYLESIFGVEPPIYVGKNNVKIGEKYTVPFSGYRDREVLINFIRPGSFQTYSFIDIANPDSFAQIQDELEGKIIIIGAAAEGIKDTFYTPWAYEYGVYIHANIVNTILKKQYLQYFPAVLQTLLLFLLIIVSVFFNLHRSGRVLVWSNITLVIIFTIVIPVFLIIYTNVILTFGFTLLVTLIFSLAVSNIVKYLLETKDKQALNKALGEYVSKDIAEEVLSGKKKINLNGERKEIAIFFSDIEGFTSVSEKFSPERLVQFLREYLGSMSNIVLEEKGFIDKYEGDAIMALWGAFGKDEDDVYRACNTALVQQKMLKMLNRKWMAEGIGEIHARIGIHTGDAIVGNIGAVGRKIEFTALGDNVNLASRLEGVNKFYGTYICVSEEVFEQTKTQLEYRCLDTIRVKGKERPVKIYELLGYAGGLDTKIEDIRKDFLRGLDLYGQQKFSQAKEIFSLLEIAGDAPSKVYNQRCEFFLSNPPAEDWDGVWNFSEK